MPTAKEPMTPQERTEVSLFAPVLFWASVITFVFSFALTVIEILGATSGDAFSVECLLCGFVFMYILRIYFGVLFMSYDETMLIAIENSGNRKKAEYSMIQFLEYTVCLLAPLVLSKKGTIGGVWVVAIETAILIVFYKIFAQEFLINDKEKKGNYLTLAVDAICGIIALAVLLLPGLTTDHKLAALSVTMLFILALMLVEFATVYRPSLSRFLRITQRSIA